MEFPIPQFVEREPKIIGPFTFHQLVFVAVAGGACFFLYFLIGKINMLLFILIAFFLMSCSVLLAFLKIQGYSLPTIIRNFFVYMVTPKIFLWYRKIVLPKVSKIKKFEKAEVPEETPLKIVKESSLQKLSTQVETKKMK
jgi:hypothetical protein